MCIRDSNSLASRISEGMFPDVRVECDVGVGLGCLLPSRQQSRDLQGLRVEHAGRSLKVASRR
eukprot:4604862-Alexandrium_andersonii.AAC.1